MPSRPDLITPSMLGHDFDATVRNFDRISGMLPTAPRLMLGPRPSKSPNNRAKLTKRYAGQPIGDCVGESGAHHGEFIANSKDGIPAGSKGRTLSALWVYQIGRAECAKHGIRLGGEGAIVSLAAQAVAAQGFATLGTYPVDAQAYRNYSDRRPLPDAAVAEAAVHRLLKFARVDSFGSMLDYVGQGFTAWVGVPIYEGMMNTGDDGWFGMSGRYVGGHGLVVTDYDETGSRPSLDFFNSWSNALWGEKTDDPELPAECRGHDNIGHTDLDAMERLFSDRSIASGEVEIIVGMDAETWESIHSFAETID